VIEGRYPTGTIFWWILIVEFITINWEYGKYFCGEVNTMKRERFVGVVGAGKCSDSVFELARDLGYQIGKKGAYTMFPKPLRLFSLLNL
jgi:hypothetical protein